MVPSFHASSSGRRRAVLLGVLLALSFLPAPAASQSDGTRVTAVVVDAVTGRALAAAAVSAGRAWAFTGADGAFALSVPASADRVTVERVGYATVTFPARQVPSRIALEPAPYLLERIAVEVEQGATLASGTALAAHVVDRAHMDVLAATSVAELLAGAEGVQTSRVGSWGSRPVLRGLTGERLAVLLDGNQVNRACTFGMDQGLASIDPGQVERVEILAGPGSALYGSGSVGGVINVVTRRPSAAEGLSGEVRAGATSAVPGGSVGGHLQVVRPRVGASVSVDASSYGDYRTPSASVDGSSYRQVTGDAKLDLRPAEAHLLSLKGQVYAGRDIGWPMMTGASIPEETRTSLSMDYGWQVGRGTLDGLSVRAFRQKLDHHMVVDAVMQGPMGPMATLSDATSWSTTTGARAQARLTPSARVRAEVGGEVTRWFAEGTRWSEQTSGSMPPKSTTFRTWPAVTITDAGAFLQGEARVADGLTVSLGGRLDRVARDAEDNPSSTETVATGNAGVRADLGRGFAGRASVGLGYRNPDPMELYGLALKPDGFVYRGRSDLETERSLNAELGLSWGGEGGGVSVTGFRNRLEDMISLRLVPGETVAGRPVREYTPLGSAVLKGLTASAEADLGAALQVRLGGSYTRAEDGATGAPVVGIPAGTVDAALRRGFGGSVLRWVEAAAEAADAQERVAESAGEKTTPGYAVLHLRAGLYLGGARITTGVENLLDREYRAHLDPTNLRRPGRNFFVRVARSF
ncbi:MAG: hypothetical protein AMXMBFR53_13320 [Gemmatimonadota bacterium]